MKNLRILFMGTPEFSVPMLDAIHQSKHELAAVVTAVDKPSGRGQKLSKSAVKVYAEQKKIPIFQPTNLKSKEFHEDLKSINPNLIVVVAFRMLPKEVWSFPEYGTFNLHASLLPQYRGAAPINWAIINGETKTGLTTFFIDEKIDTGEIIDQVPLPINISDNVEDVYTRMLPKGSQLVMQTIDNIAEGNVNTRIQEKHQILRKAPKLNKDNTRINWSDSPVDIFNMVRGLSPYPLAWTMLVNGEEKIQCKVSDVSYQYKKHTKSVGEIIIENKSLFVAVKDGFVEILKLKLAGKRLLSTKDLLNGYDIITSSKML